MGAGDATEGRAVVRAALGMLAALLVGVAACETDPNAPGRRGGGLGGGRGDVVEVSGDWVYNASNLAAAGLTCNVSNVSLSLQQKDSTFTGTYSGGQVACVGPGVAPDSVQFGTGVVLNGLVRGDSIFFDLDTPDWRSRGRLTGNSISGETVVRIDFGLDGAFFLVGPFGAVKQ